MFIFLVETIFRTSNGAIDFLLEELVASLKNANIGYKYYSRILALNLFLLCSGAYFLIFYIMIPSMLAQVAKTRELIKILPDSLLKSNQPLRKVFIEKGRKIK